MKIQLFAGLVLTNLVLASGNPREGRPLPVGITVRVVSSPVVSVKTLLDAEKRAGQILGKAGIEVRWLACPSRNSSEEMTNPCAQDRGPTDLWLHVLESSPHTFHGDANGLAVLTPLWEEGEGYAVVSYAMARAAAKTLDDDIEYVLGATIAHEVGHLLLGAAHSQAGVMSPHFGHQQIRMAARGELLFTAEQSARLRSAVLRRLAP